LFSNNRKVQRARPLGGLEQAKAISLASFRCLPIRAAHPDRAPLFQGRIPRLLSENGFVCWSLASATSL